MQHLSLATLCAAVLFIVCTSCVTRNSSTDYLVVIDEEALNDNHDSIRQFLTTDILKYEDKIPVPSFNSKIILESDSVRKELPLIEPNLAQQLAGSRQSWRNYRKKITKRFDGDEWLDLFEPIVVMSNNISPMLSIQCGNGSMRTDTNVNTDMGILAVIEQKLIDEEEDLGKITLDLSECYQAGPAPALPTAIDLKKETYITLRRWYKSLEKVYGSTTDPEDLKERIDFVRSVCTQDCRIEIQNKGQEKQVFTVEEFLTRIRSEKRYQYEDVRIFMRNYSVLKDYEPTDDSDLPPELAALITYDKEFSGYRNGRLVYQDRIAKEVDLVAKPRVEWQDGSKKSVYKIYIKRIAVVGAPQ